jgi:hypothetical protein
VTFVGGGNDILGTDGPSGPAGPTTTNPDFFTFNVPVGLALTAITVLPGTMSAGIDNVSFIGIEGGTQITLPRPAPSAAGLLGWWHFGPGDIGTDILPEMGIPADGCPGSRHPSAPATTRSGSWRWTMLAAAHTATMVSILC